MTEQAFGIDKIQLVKLLRRVAEGEAQLPEFQRGWVWPDHNIIGLLASISRGYPVGTLMLLQTGGDVRFKWRPVEGATPPPGTEPDTLILDGQQRMTSLFQSLMLGKPVETQNQRKQRITGWFYVDMVKALDPQADREDAIRLLAGGPGGPQLPWRSHRGLLDPGEGIRGPALPALPALFQPRLELRIRGLLEGPGAGRPQVVAGLRGGIHPPLRGSTRCR